MPRATTTSAAWSRARLLASTMRMRDVQGSKTCSPCSCGSGGEPPPEQACKPPQQARPLRALERSGDTEGFAWRPTNREQNHKTPPNWTAPTPRSQLHPQDWSVDGEQNPLFYDLPEEEGEQDPLFHELPLSRLLSWNRWWHLTAKVIRLVFQKRSWGVTGPYLKKKKGIVTNRLVLLRANWSARGQELKYTKHLGDCDSDCSSA